MRIGGVSASSPSLPLSKGAFLRSTAGAILLGLAALLVIVGTTLWLVGETRTYSNTITSARLQRSALADLRSLLQDLETGQRGYLLTGKEEYLAPYEDAEKKIGSQLDQVRSLLTNPRQTTEVDRLASVMTSKLAELRGTIDLFRSSSHDEALALVKTDQDRELMDEARDIFNRLIPQAEARIDDSVAQQNRSIAALRWATLLSALVIIVVVGGSAWMVVRYTGQLVEAQQELQALNTELEDRVRERTADLHRANEEIQRFAYIVTHDLRAPLVNIMGFTSELETSLASIRSYVEQSPAASEGAVAGNARKAAVEEAPEALGFIRSSTRKMDGLINAILKLSREGRRTLKPEPIDLGSLLHTVAASVQHQVVAAGGEVSIDGAAPRMVSDRLALEQIFGNLLDNAVKCRFPSQPLHITQVRVPTDKAVSIGVIVTELVTNAFKYAYPNDGGGEIRVRFHQTGGRGMLSVEDDGFGCGEDDPSKGTGVGSASWPPWRAGLTPLSTMAVPRAPGIPALGGS